MHVGEQSGGPWMSPLGCHGVSEVGLSRVEGEDDPEPVCPAPWIAAATPQPASAQPAPSVPPDSSTPTPPGLPGGEGNLEDPAQPSTGCSALPSVGLGAPLLVLALAGSRRRQRRP
jgi:MYXO-CTERM domain-containing protein